MSVALDLTGQKIGMLAVKRRAPDVIVGKDKRHLRAWYCDCDCGTKDFITTKWMALICVNRENKYLGRYPSFKEAKNARKQAEEKYYGEYSYDNSMREGEKFGDLSYIP